MPSRPDTPAHGALRRPIPAAVLFLWLVLAATPAAGQGRLAPQPAAPHYDVVALRVEFEPDTTRFTTGDGTFASSPYDTLRPKLDPLPHDAAYFRAHLAFLEDYVARVSDGRTTLTTHLVPDVVRVTRPMSAYAPTGFEADSPAERAKLAALVQEAWTRGSAESDFDMRGFDPATTVFVLFHAGVGRDIELTGTTLDRTPGDLPSLYFDRAALRALLPGAERSFNGFPVEHTILMPRSETRRGVNVLTDEPFLLELSINGLLAASFFNALGVPDLFDTSTGESAIGPFGLMDPLGFFAYGGLFPPEPSAWTKAYLGWVDPVAVEGADEREVALRAAGLTDGPSVAAVPVSEGEYFLVENRHRDPAGDGLVLRVWREGEVVEQRVADGDETFDAFTQEGFVGGVVVGVDDYDWALPGGVDEAGERLLGGLLVWHVDERRIAAGLATNTVNADRERRGLDLEEADGAQDLGHTSGSPFGPQGETGTPFDFFYRGNPASVETATGRIVRLYENRFGPATTPSSATNAGGPSFVMLDEFSTPGPTMTFTYRQAVPETVAPIALPRLPSGVPAGPGSAIGSGFDGAIIAYAADSEALADGAPAGGVYRVHGDTVQTISTAAAARPAVLPDGTVVVLEGDDAGRRWLRVFRSGTDEARIVALPDASTGRYPLGPPAVDGGDVVILFDRGGAPLLVRVANLGDEPAVSQREIEGVGAGVSLAVVPGVGLAVAGTEGAVVEGTEEVRWRYDTGGLSGRAQAVFGRDGAGIVGVVPLPLEGRLRWLLPDGTRYDIAAGESVGSIAARSPVLVDLDGDALLDVLVAAGAHLVAYTRSGAVVRGFPIALPARVEGQPLVAERAGSTGQMVVVAARDGQVYAYDPQADGRLLDGFPLAAGASASATPLLQDDVLYAVSEDGALRAWRLDGVGAALWGEAYGGPGNPSAAMLDAAPPALGGPLIDPRETYNWPNPVRGGPTYIRCTTVEDAHVAVTIVDMAGSVLATFDLETRAGLPREVAWAADVPSGVYYARLRARAVDGATATHVIKMAVIR